MVEQLLGPGPARSVPTRRPDQRRRADDKQPADSSIALLADPAEPLLAAAGARLRLEAEPGGELSIGQEQSRYQGWASPVGRSRRPDGHPVRAAHGPPLGDAAGRDELRLRHELLAPAARLAGRRCVGGAWIRCCSSASTRWARSTGAGRASTARACRRNVCPAPSASGSGSVGLSSLHKRIRPSGFAVGQDGDPRVLGLIKGSASNAIFAGRLPEHRSTVRPSSSHHPPTSVGRRAARPELGSGGHGRRLVPPMAQKRPDDARHLGCQGDHRRVGMRPRQQSTQPLPEPRRVEAAILLERCRRDSAPAVAALHVAAHNPEALVLILPADHAIGDHEAFVAAVRATRAGAQAGYIMTLGIAPTHPSPPTATSSPTPAARQGRRGERPRRRPLPR